jgi:hypothetical protein
VCMFIEMSVRAFVSLMYCVIRNKCVVGFDQVVGSNKVLLGVIKHLVCLLFFS